MLFKTKLIIIYITNKYNANEHFVNTRTKLLDQLVHEKTFYFLFLYGSV